MSLRLHVRADYLNVPSATREEAKHLPGHRGLPAPASATDPRSGERYRTSPTGERAKLKLPSTASTERAPLSHHREVKLSEVRGCLYKQVIVHCTQLIYERSLWQSSRKKELFLPYLKNLAAAAAHQL